jgi:hypothetical protein
MKECETESVKGSVWTSGVCTKHQSLATYFTFLPVELYFPQREGRIQSAERAVPTSIHTIRIRTFFQPYWQT